MVIKTEHDLANFLLPDIYTKTVNVETFLLLDNNNGKFRVLIFNTAENVKIMQKTGPQMELFVGYPWAF